MRRRFRLAPFLFTAAAALCDVGSGQSVVQPKSPPRPQVEETGAATSNAAPLPDPATLLHEVEANEEHMDALRNDYTYHVHLEQQRLRKDGSVKDDEITDSESLTLDGVRVNRVVARNGKPLDGQEQAKEGQRLDREVAKVKERRAKAAADGQKTDPRGDTVITVARLLELGTFSNERRVTYGGRPTIVLDYAGDPRAKTRSPAEAVVKDLVGTVWIDETDHVLVHGQGQFLNDFKVGGGLIADVHKGSNFDFEAKRVNDSVWLPATINGEGSVRVLLVSGFEGKLHLTVSDYRRFRTSTKILAGPPAPSNEIDGTKSSPAESLNPKLSGKGPS